MSTPVAIAAGSIIAAGALLKATEEEALLSGPEYIRDAEPEGLTRRIGLGLARAACQRYANDPTRISPARAVQFENACRPYLDSLMGGTGPSISKPFSGGQCPARYFVVARWQNTNTDGSLGVVNEQNVTGTLGRPGPIRGIERRGGPGAWEMVLLHGTDSLFTSPESVVRTSTSENNSFEPLAIASVSRVDEQPDNCGNPAPVVEPPTPPSPPFLIPVPIIISPDINIEADVEINVDGSITFDIGTGDITIDPFGDNDDSGSGGDGGADDSPPAPEPGPDLPGGNGGFGGDDLFGDPPAGRRWVGCCITITVRPTNQPPIPNTIPEDVYASVVGNIRLVYDAAGTRQTDTPVRIQARKVCVWEAVRKLNPVGVSVDLQPGFGYRYRPYSVPLDA